MKALFVSLFFAMAGVLPLFAATDGEVHARKIALDVAGAFSNDGFKIRDGNWAGGIKTGENLIIQVNLYAGNAYWFSLGATEPAKKLAVSIYDDTGQLVESDPYQDTGKAAAGFSPTASGCYYVKIQELEGEPADFCLIYSYK